MQTEFGDLFAPTFENTEDAVRRGVLEGVPAAIKFLSLRLPRFVGARGLAPDALMQAQGARGMDPFASSVMQTLLQTLTGGSGGGRSAPTPVIIPGLDDNTGATLAPAPEPETFPGPEPRIPGRVPRVPSRPTRFGGSTL